MLGREEKREKEWRGQRGVARAGEEEMKDSLRLSLSELHLIHTLSEVPMQESLPPVHAVGWRARNGNEAKRRASESVSEERDASMEISRGRENVRRELRVRSLEKLLDGSAVSDEGSGLLDTDGRNVTDRGEDGVGDPLDEGLESTKESLVSTKLSRKRR